MPEPTPQEQEARRQWQSQQQLARASTTAQLPATPGPTAVSQNEGENMEEQWGRDLTRERIQQLQQKTGFKETLSGMVGRLSDPELGLEDNDDFQMLKKMSKAIAKDSPVQATKAGLEIGHELRQHIATGSFQAFLLALGFAVVKDFADVLDIETLGTVGSLINFAVTAALIMIVMFQGIWFKRLIIKKMWKRWLGAVVAEFIPVVNFFPWWIISVLLVKREADKKRKQHQRALEELEADLEALQKAEPMSSPEVKEESA